MNDTEMGWGMTLFLWLFLTPFIVIGAGMIGSFFLCIAGRTEITISSNQGCIFTGIGPLGWTRRFSPSEVSHVKLGIKRWRNEDSDPNYNSVVQINLNNGKKIRFGSSLRKEYKAYLARELIELIG